MFIDGRTGLPLAPETRTIFPGIHLRPEGGIIRKGLNIYPLRDWRRSRGFILRVSDSLQYHWRWSVAQQRLCSGWDRR
jgi:hypothetical protein